MIETILAQSTDLGTTEAFVAKLAMNSKAAKDVADAVGGKDAVLEPKYDGIRLLFHVSEDGVRSFTRSGKEQTGKLPAIEAALYERLPADTWLDGEAVVFNENGTQDWGGAQGVLGSGVAKAALRSGAVTFVIFDLLAFDGKDARPLTLRQRRELLDDLTSEWVVANIMLSPQVAPTDEAHEANLVAGFEGSMVKHLDAAYESGKRSKASLKLKATDTEDCVITGFAPAAPDSWIAAAGLIGTIVFEHYQDGVAIEGRCSGMTEAERQSITFNQDSLIGTVVEVSYMTKMPSGTLRHPQFKRLRDDKTAAECRAN